MDFFHVLNRGVEKRDIFIDDKDRIRFLRGLWAFNTTRPVEQRELFTSNQNPDLRNPEPPLVDLHGWCLMRNHYHLLLSPKQEGGITKFIRKLNVGYANYFNERYDRSGALFQGRTKKVHITTHAHILYILHYIHLNPLDYLRTSKNWRDGKIVQTKEAFQHLDKYRWSSYHDYLSPRSEMPFTTTDFFSELHNNYSDKLKKYVTVMELDSVRPLTLE